jgi:D-sedoheptulose 7-phosphate isomerase
VIAITGGRPNRLATAADIAIHAPAVETPLIQELHTVVLHVLCDMVEAAMAASEVGAAAK